MSLVSYPNAPCTCTYSHFADPVLDLDSMDDQALLIDLLAHGIPYTPPSLHRGVRLKRQQYLERKDICCTSCEEENSFRCRAEHHTRHKGRTLLAAKLRSAINVINKALSMFR